MTATTRECAPTRDASVQPLLEVREVTVRAGHRTLVDAVSFEVRPGEIVAIIGPNGAGKTTLLEAIVGLRPARREVRVREKLLESFADSAASFAFAPDDASPPPEPLVATLVRHAHRCGGRDDAHLERLQRGLGIEPLFRRSAAQLSHGERKRVVLYEALSVARPVVVLDEPFGAFDPLQLRDVAAAVRSVAEAGSAILVSVHQLALAERIADRILLLAEGRRLAFGTAEAIRRDAGSAASLEDAFITLLSSRGERSHA